MKKNIDKNQTYVVSIPTVNSESFEIHTEICAKSIDEAKEDFLRRLLRADSALSILLAIDTELKAKVWTAISVVDMTTAYKEKIDNAKAFMEKCIAELTSNPTRDKFVELCREYDSLYSYDFTQCAPYRDALKKM